MTTSSRTRLVAIAVVALLATGCGGRWYEASPVSDPSDPFTDREPTKAQWFNSASEVDCFTVRALYSDGWREGGVSLGTFCRQGGPR